MKTSLVILLAVFLVVWVVGWRYAWRYAATHPTVVRPLAVTEIVIYGGAVIGALREGNLWGSAVGILAVINGVMTYRTKRNWWRTPRPPRGASHRELTETARTSTDR